MWLDESCTLIKFDSLEQSWIQEKCLLSSHTRRENDLAYSPACLPGTSHEETISEDTSIAAWICPLGCEEPSLGLEGILHAISQKFKAETI